MAYESASATIRPTMTTVFGRVARLIELAAGNADRAKSICDELNGPTPEAGAHARNADGPSNGRISDLDQMLGMLETHLMRVSNAESLIEMGLGRLTDIDTVAEGRAEKGRY